MVDVHSIDFTGKFVNDQYSEEPAAYLEALDLDKCILMQFTGLYDKNKKPIFEGDLLSDGAGHDMVEWDKENACFTLGDNFQNGDGGLTWDVLEIVGNAFENPELLDK